MSTTNHHHRRRRRTSLLAAAMCTMCVDAYTTGNTAVHTALTPKSSSSTVPAAADLVSTATPVPKKLVLNVPDFERMDPMPWSQSIAATDDNVAEPPLLYMPFWTWQKSFMKEALPNLQRVSCEEFSYNENLKKKARIINECYTAPGLYSKIRMTYYDAGEGCQVFNSLWYPDPKAHNLPLLGIDLLSFNRRKFLGIVDFQPLYNEDGQDEHDPIASGYEEGLLKPIKEKYEFLAGQSMSSKFYDETQFFSRQMLFSRFEEEDIISNELFPAYQDYVQAHVDLVTSNAELERVVDEKAVLERYDSYDTYSAVRDPAAGLFAAMFGKEWSDGFVHDFLFERCDKEEAAKAAALVASQRKGGPPGQQQRSQGQDQKVASA